MPYKNYQEFIEYLKYLNDTERILYAIYEYFRDYVSYNYDQLQAGKLDNGDGKLDEIKQYALTLEPNESSKQELLQLLDEEFMRVEGRPVTPANRELFFKNYGKIIHHEARPKQKEYLKY